MVGYDTVVVFHIVETVSRSGNVFLYFFLKRCVYREILVPISMIAPFVLLVVFDIMSYLSHTET